LTRRKMSRGPPVSPSWAGEVAERRSETFRLSERAQGINASDIRVLRGQHEFLVKIPDDFVEFIVQARRYAKIYRILQHYGFGAGRRAALGPRRIKRGCR